MRIIGNIPHKSIHITVFGMNDKFIIQFEAGFMEQIFKINQNEIAGLEGIQELLDESFMQKITARFNEMFTEFNQAQERLKVKTSIK
ncbi:MAG: hypothetical protein ABI199_08840 [Bacteroidia bacterium]